LSKRRCTDAHNILNASEDGELSNDGFSNVLPTTSNQTPAAKANPRSPLKHVDSASAEPNNNLVEPPVQTLNNAANNNQIILASSDLAVPLIVPIGDHVEEWVSLRRSGTRIVSQRTFGCQTSPSLEALKLD
jgi:hypothetical protein